MTKTKYLIYKCKCGFTCNRAVKSEPYGEVRCKKCKQPVEFIVKEK